MPGLKRLGEQLKKDYIDFSDLQHKLENFRPDEDGWHWSPSQYPFKATVVSTTNEIVVTGQDGSVARLIEGDKLGIMDWTVWTVNGPGRYPNDPFRRILSRTRMSQRLLVVSSRDVEYDTEDGKVSVFGEHDDNIVSTRSVMWNSQGGHFHDLEPIEVSYEKRCVSGGDIVILYEGSPEDWDGRRHFAISRIHVRPKALQNDEAVMWFESKFRDTTIETDRITATRAAQERLEAIRTASREKIAAQTEVANAEKAWRKIVSQPEGTTFVFGPHKYIVHHKPGGTRGLVYMNFIGGTPISFEKAQKKGLLEAWAKEVSENCVTTVTRLR